MSQTPTMARIEPPGAGDEQGVRAWVEAAADVYGLGRPVAPARPAARGQMGIVWLLETDRGRFAVKQLLRALDEADVETEVAFQSEMVRRGVPAPAPLRTTDGRVLADVDGLLVRVSTWVDLDEPRTDLDPAAVGALLALMHRDPLPAQPPVDPWYVEAVPSPVWDELGTALAAAGAPFAAEFAGFARHQLRVQDEFTQPRAVQLCHRDLWADNLRTTPAGGLCVIDWDLCGPADPSHELAVLLVEFCCGRPERARILTAAYRDGGGTGRVSGRGDFTMAQAQFGHFATTAARQWLATTEEQARARAEAWFRLCLEAPLDVGRMDELLAAVAP
jgi:Ser/Thr protein kinase RdoA (MazF antagonist)